MFLSSFFLFVCHHQIPLIQCRPESSRESLLAKSRQGKATKRFFQRNKFLVYSGALSLFVIFHHRPFYPYLTWMHWGTTTFLNCNVIWIVQITILLVCFALPSLHRSCDGHAACVFGSSFVLHFNDLWPSHLWRFKSKSNTSCVCADKYVERVNISSSKWR